MSPRIKPATGWVQGDCRTWLHEASLGGPTCLAVFFEYTPPVDSNLRLIIHPRLLVTASGQPRIRRTLMHAAAVAHLCGKTIITRFFFFFFFPLAFKIQDTTAIKRGVLIDFQNHTLCRKYISKGRARVAPVIRSAWFKHAKAMFKPPANTY